MGHEPVDAVKEGRDGWKERRDLLNMFKAKAVAAIRTEAKGEGVVALRGLEKDETVLVERAVSSTCDMPLPKYDAYCAHCGEKDINQAAALQCKDCGVVFCGAECNEASGTWHHSGTLGLCSKDLTALLHQLSDQLKQAYYAALLGAPQDVEEGSMGAEELKIILQVFTDCILTMKLVSTLHGIDVLPKGLDTWTRGLSEEQKERGEAIIGNFLSNIGDCVQGFDEATFMKAYDVCVTNSWPGNSSRHLFAAHSLLNHACTPNTVCSMMPKATLRVSTLGALPSGAELCIDYTDGKPPKSLSEEERDELEAQWGHPCLCAECAKSE